MMNTKFINISKSLRKKRENENESKLVLQKGVLVYKRKCNKKKGKQITNIMPKKIRTRK